MKFWKLFLFRLAYLIIGFTVLYFITPTLWRAGFEVFSAFIGKGLTIFFFSVFVVLAALPRNR
jgi:hypothetical protein